MMSDDDRGVVANDESLDNLGICYGHLTSWLQLASLPSTSLSAVSTLKSSRTCGVARLDVMGETLNLESWMACE